eukprot:Gb_35673 [translate_table: standard]
MTQLGSSILSSLGSALQSFPYPLFSSSQRAINAIPNCIVEGFESNLAMKLESLKQTTQINLEWLQQALVVVLFTHTTVADTIPDLQLPLTEKDQRLINDYLDDSVKLLDACNVLRESFADVQRYQILVQLALHSLDHNKETLNEKKILRAKSVLHECIMAIKKKDEELDRQGQQKSKLENCSSMLRRMGEKLNTNIAMVDEPTRANYKNNAVVFSAMYGAKAATIFLCGLLAAALLVKPKKLLPSLHLANQPSWSSSMLKLQQKVKEEIDKRKAIKGSTALLQELDNVHSQVKELYQILNSMFNSDQKNFSAISKAKMDEVEQSVPMLKKCAEDLQKGLVPLEHQVNDIYRMLVSSRVTLLGVLSHMRN